MELFPAIDLQNGQCVRLVRGDFDAATVYDADPPRIARRFAEAGARWLHVVDLDGARAGESRQFELIARIAGETPLKVQVGGGIRKTSTIERFIAAGAERIVVGSLAINNRLLVMEWLEHFGPGRIVLAFDVRLDGKGEPEVLTHGWQSGSQRSLWELLDAYAGGSGLQTVLCTDVGRDGMLGGPNEELYKAIQKCHPELAILASGGVSEMADLLSLAKFGLAGAVVGKAIYEGRVDLAKALAALKGGIDAG